MVIQERDNASDDVLMRKLANGDPATLGAVYARFAPELLRCARGVLGNNVEAEDLIHDIFLDLWRRPSAFDSRKGTLASWLKTRVKWRAIDRCRERKTETRLRQPGFLSAGLPDVEVVDDCRRSLADRCFESVSPGQQQVLHLLYWHGCTCREAAVRLGIPVGTVKSRLSLALRALRKRGPFADAWAA